MRGVELQSILNFLLDSAVGSLSAQSFGSVFADSSGAPLTHLISRPDVCFLLLEGIAICRYFPLDSEPLDEDQP